MQEKYNTQSAARQLQAQDIVGQISQYSILPLIPAWRKLHAGCEWLFSECGHGRALPLGGGSPANVGAGSPALGNTVLSDKDLDPQKVWGPNHSRGGCREVERRKFHDRKPRLTGGELVAVGMVESA